MSNRLTFSLASLILIFALAFAATPVLAQVTVFEVVEYSGDEAAAAAPASPQVLHDQQRDDFRLQITFDGGVQGSGAAGVFQDGDFAYQSRDDGVWSNPVAIAATSVTGRYESTTAGTVNLSDTVFVITLPSQDATVAAGLTLTDVRLTIPRDKILGKADGNYVAPYSSPDFELPPLSNNGTDTVEATAVSFGTPTAVTGTVSSYDVTLELTGFTTTAGLPTGLVIDGSGLLASAVLGVMPTGGATVTLAPVVAPATANPVVSATSTTYTFRVVVPLGDVVTLTLPANYVGMAASVIVPVSLPAPTNVTAMADTARGTIEVEWDWAGTAADLEAYEITWNYGASRMATSSTTSYTIPTDELILGTPTTVMVRALSTATAAAAGTENSPSVASTPASVTPSDSGRPDVGVVAPEDPLSGLTGANANRNGNLVFTLEFTELIDLDQSFAGTFDRSGPSNIRFYQGVTPTFVSGPETGTVAGVTAGQMVYKYEIEVSPRDPAEDTTLLVNAGTVMDLNGLDNPFDREATYEIPDPPPGDTTKPTVMIGLASDMYVDCSVGSQLSFTIGNEASGTALAAGNGRTVQASEVSTTTPGWTIASNGGNVWVVPDSNDRNAAIGVTEVTVTVAANAVRDTATPNANGNVSTSETFTIGPVLTIPANSYIVVIHSDHANRTHLRGYDNATGMPVGRPLVVGSTTVIGTNTNIQYWDCMPDLTIFFGLNAPAIGGGAIVVKVSPEHGQTATTRDANGNPLAVPRGSVGLSEIMWGSDEGIPHGGIAPQDAIAGRRGQSNLDQTREQWIELHNRNNHDVIVTLVARPTNTALTNEGNAEIDRVSNYNISTASRNVWAVPGQSGNSEFGINFVSMQRGKHDGSGGNAGQAPTTGQGYVHGDWNGSGSTRWTASTHVYQTARAGLWQTLAPENQNYNYVGTPGGPNKLTPDTLPNPTPVSKAVIFNEVANLRDQTLEWIELKNNTNGNINLRNYHISFVDGVDSEKPLYTFPNNDDVQVPAGGILLLLASDPRYNDDHPVAVGYNVHGGNDQALGIAKDADVPRYVVMSRVSDGNRGYESGGLPDNGNFVLMLRRPDGHDQHDTARNKMGGGGNMVDLVGYHPNLVKDSGGPPLYTRLWPLTLFNSPNRTRNKMEEETVHYRRNVGANPDSGDNNIPEQIALNNAVYTGVGYKRFASRHNPAHYGTPGYDHSALVKQLAGDVGGGGVVTISEIMLDQGDGPYPQWIELYNSSDSPVNLHADDHGWRLVIENYDDGEIDIKRLSGTLNFRDSDVQTILPKQTVVVTSSRARRSGSAFFDTSVIFPPTRVFSVYDDARGVLNVNRTTDPILSTQGFYIELIDGKGNVSDSIGNLVPNPGRRVATQNTIKWPLSDITGEMMEDAPRSSILRRYREPKGGDSKDWEAYTADELVDMGITAEGWVLASMTNFRHVRQTWYGHQTDVGSPGITGGRVLPVSLSKFRPERNPDDGTVVIRWITESELNNAGFNILRSETRDGEFTQINTKLIAGHGTTSERNTYEFTDTSAKPNVVYYYQIQDVSIDGEVQPLRITHLRGNVSAAGKLTTTWGELKALQ